MPCAPVNVSTQLDCDTNIVTVSWDSAAMPLNYSVIAIAPDDSSVSCDTGDTTCDLSGLQCGQLYTVKVMASLGTCSGPYSAPLSIHTGNKDVGGDGEVYDEVHAAAADDEYVFCYHSNKYSMKKLRCGITDC